VYRHEYRTCGSATIRQLMNLIYLRETEVRRRCCLGLLRGVSIGRGFLLLLLRPLNLRDAMPAKG
jgi:hypothetical protein